MLDRKRFTITIDVECHEEDVPIKGNCSAIDAATDRKAERWIERQLARGNPWAWCCVKVVAELDGVTGEDYLGTCSYRGADEFCHWEGMYFPDMVERAVGQLLERLKGRSEAKGK